MDKCPQCGWVEPTNLKQIHNRMNIYVEDDTDKVVGVFNEYSDYLTVKGKKLRKQDVPKAVIAAVKK